MKKNVRIFSTLLLLGLVNLIFFQNCSNDNFKISQTPQSILSAPDEGAPIAETPVAPSEPIFTEPSGAAITYVTKQTQYSVSSDLDILIIGDNSGSMATEQKEMANRFLNFIDSIQDLNFRIAITTTDVRSQSAAGRLKLFSSSLNYLDKSLGLSIGDISARFSSAIYLGTSGSGDERGIYALNQAIKNNTEVTSEKWMRPSAHLAVIILSDEDERSRGGLDGLSIEEMDKPESVLKTLAAYQGNQKTISVHSIVVRSGDSKCLSAQGAGYYGTFYEKLSGLTGGIIGDICASSYTDQLLDMASKAKENVGSVNLDCIPVQDQDHSLYVFVNGTLVDPMMYRLENSQLLFNVQLNLGSKVTAKYICASK